MIVRAEMRMATEIDRGQASRDVARPNQPVSQYVHVSDIPSTLDELGVPRQRLQEWRETRDAGPEDEAPLRVRASHTCRHFRQMHKLRWFLRMKSRYSVWTDWHFGHGGTRITE
jgi:hypothetical protein